MLRVPAGSRNQRMSSELCVVSANMTVADNIRARASKFRRVKRARPEKESVDRVAERYGALGPLLYRKPAQLSWRSAKQRVALARVLGF